MSLKLAFSKDMKGSEPNAFMDWGEPAINIQTSEDLIAITPHDFRALAMYWLTNMDLQPDDERLKFIGQVAALNTVCGYNPGKVRLG